MMGSVANRLQQGEKRVSQLLETKWVLQVGRYLLCGCCGFVLSAASLLGSSQALALGLVCAAQQGAAVCVAAGGALGYLLFWGQDIQALCWMVLGLITALTVGRRPLLRQAAFLLPSLAGLIVAGCGVFFQVFQGDTTPISVYLLRLLGAVGSTGLFLQASERRSPVTARLIGAVAVLAVSRIELFGLVGLGYVAAGAIAVFGDFPGVILAGVGLDIARVAPVPMTAVMCASYLFRLLPRGVERTRYFGAFAGYLLFSVLGGTENYLPAFWLLLGSGIGGFVPYPKAAPRRSGSSGNTQVQLETAAGVLSRSGSVLGEMRSAPPDEQALLDTAQKTACAGCPHRKSCEQKDQTLPVDLLHREHLTSDAIYCRKSGRLVGEILRAQQRYRLLLMQHRDRENCRQALCQQYQFLADYLQRLSDGFLAVPGLPARYQPEVALCTAGKQEVCGDTGTWFGGVGNRYYLLLSDGMGTGIEAARESRRAVWYLREMLRAGFPGEYAMQSLNSFCMLQGVSGIATADLVQVQLDTGRAVLYKWGAAPSYLVRGGQLRRIEGSTGAMGMAIGGPNSSQMPIQLRAGDYLILLSDGVGSETVQSLPEKLWTEPAGEVAGAILAHRPREIRDDASVLVMCLRSAPHQKRK